jgi:hypothetical protein
MKIIFDHSNGYVKNDKVFCEAFTLPERETEDELLELGYLPNPFTNYWYQAKSCRINNDKIKLSPKRKKILSKLEVYIYSYQNIKEDVDSFFQRYTQRKKFNLIDYYNSNSKFDDIKVTEIRYNGDVVAYTRFREFEKVNLLLEVGYTSLNEVNPTFIKDLTNFSLGKDAILSLSNYGKTQNKNLLYIYESYKDYFPYKLEITGCEFWEGEKWISTDI